MENEKNLKQFTRVLVCVIVAVLCVAAISRGVTRIGSNITSDGTLSVTGTSTFSGNVGIGTASPEAKFEIAGINTDVLILGNSSTEGGDIAVYEDSSANKSLTFDADTASLNVARNSVNWTQVNTAGFGSTNNSYAQALCVFNDYLYIGTTNSTDGTTVWRTQDGTNWTQANTSGFGSTNNARIYPLIVFNGYLYAGTTNDTDGGQVWRTADGTTWSQVSISGFGNSNNSRVYSFTIFNGYLYAGTKNTTDGGQIWRSADGINWSQVNTSGFGTTNNSQIRSLKTYNSYLYAGTINSTDGTQIWRSQDGINWTQANTSGFGESRTTTPALEEFKGALYAGTTYDGIYRTYDGTTWTKVGTTPGQEILSLITYNGYLYAGTYNSCEVWRSSNGTTWTQVNTDGFGDSNNNNARINTSFNGSLYVGTYNPTEGAEIWRLTTGLLQNTTGAIVVKGITAGEVHIQSSGRISGVTDLYSIKATFGSAGISENLVIGNDLLLDDTGRIYFGKDQDFNFQYASTTDKLALTATNKDFYMNLGSGKFGIGTTTPGASLDIDNGTATTTIEVGDALTNGKGACFKLRDVDDAGWTYCYVLNGEMTCTSTSCE